MAVQGGKPVDVLCCRLPFRDAPAGRNSMEVQVRNCDECESTLTVEEKAVRRYEIGGLPHVELHGVEVSNCPKCGKEGIAIPRMGQLHRVLAHTFLKQERMLAPDE